jgi:cardiolipin synthase
VDSYDWTVKALAAFDLLLRVGVSLRVIMRRLPVGVSLAWLAVVLPFPFIGSIAYLLVGETRLGWRRAKRARAIHEPYRQWLGELGRRGEVDWSCLGADCHPLARLAEATVGIPALGGNAVQLLGGSERFFEALLADIDAARRSCHLEFYIWAEGGRADAVVEALLRAAARGVTCRVLVDGVGSRPFLHGRQARRLREGGVDLRAALRVSLLALPFVRFDLRLHRKVVVIDGAVGYTGSHNLADPEFFKKGAGVGQWVDAMVRLRGPVVEALAVTFLEDWDLETGVGIEELRRTSDAHPLEPDGPSVVQVVPSGPATGGDLIEKIVLAAIYAARKELVLTTPYFVPDEAMLMALTTAARQGVAVTLVVPERVDSRMVRLASRAHQGDLLAAGVRVAQFRRGLLHTKSVTVDGQFSLFGSLNLDPRSLRLNFELTLAVYDPAATAELRRLQESYIEQSDLLDAKALEARGPVERFAENAARLVSPLL